VKQSAQACFEGEHGLLGLILTAPLWSDKLRPHLRAFYSYCPVLCQELFWPCT